MIAEAKDNPRKDGSCQIQIVLAKDEQESPEQFEARASALTLGVQHVEMALGEGRDLLTIKLVLLPGAEEAEFDVNAIPQEQLMRELDNLPVSSVKNQIEY